MAQKLTIKICGITSSIIAQYLSDIGADFLGFVHHKNSPRHLTLLQYHNITRSLVTDSKITLVTVAPEDALLDAIIRLKKPDYLQIHGKVTAARLDDVKAKYDIGIIAALSHADLNQKQIDEYGATSDYLLIDSASNKDGDYGGTGRNFAWHQLNNFHFTKPYFLSGGLNAGNIKAALQASGADHIDLSSGVETEPGVKTKAKIYEFINYLKDNELR
jgi:phosphoribosylanthranilate isomerase